MKRILRLALAAVVAVIAAVALTAQMEAKADTDVKALFLNVGKADAAILFLGDSRYLVDTGTSDSYDALRRAMDTYGIVKLDGIVLTHTHKDHVGGLKKLLKGGISVDMLYAGALHTEASDEEHTVYKSSQKYDVPLTWLKAGDEISTGEGCVMRVLGPLTLDAENENNNSLVIELITPEGNMLLTGDMELEEEAQLLESGLIPQAKVLKVAHHGDDDATSVELVAAVMPQWAVISTSSGEEPDTPDKKVLTRLWNAGSGTAVTEDATLGILITLKGGEAAAQSLNYN